MRKRISCCFFPTTVVMIDDDRRFLNLSKAKLANYYPIQAFSDPDKALHYLNNEYAPDLFTSRSILYREEKHRDHRNMEVNVRAIYPEIYNPNRFGQISVIVIDYAMPDLNGLEFCRRLKNKNIRVILLTGEAEHDIAVKAFNEGIIHKFLLKSTANLAERLLELIMEEQKNYFFNLSEIIINSLTKNPEHPPSCLDDPMFINLFNQTIQQHKIIEYYLTDAKGSFMLLNEHGKPGWLAVKDEEAMIADVFDAENCDISVDPIILDALRRREKLVYLHTEEDFKKYPSEWLPYLHPAIRLAGKSTYYYAYITDAEKYAIQSSKILSYREYLNKL